MRKVLVTVLLSIAYSGYAQQEPPSALEMGAFGCKAVPLAEAGEQERWLVSLHFPQVQEAAIALDARFCEALNNPVANDLPMRQLAAFGVLAASKAKEAFRGTGEEDDVSIVMQAFADVLNSGEEFPSTMPDLEIFLPVRGGPGSPVAYSVTVDGMERFAVTSESDKSCEENLGATCSEVLQDLDQAIRPYKKSYQIYVTSQNSRALAELQRQWDEYFDTARSMTTLDLVLTSVLERKHFRKGYLDGPVERQWFALRPNIVLLYTGDAPKGERLEPGLAIEWFGVNDWNGGLFGLPLGASIVSVYSDTPTVSSIGHGITLHIDNRYSIGWAEHDGDSSFHVSADLLALFSDRRSEFESYKEALLDLQ